MKKLLLSLIVFAGASLAQIPADQSVTRPDHMMISGDLGACNEGETEYNLLSHVGKRCTSANTWAPIVAVASPIANQVYLVNASSLPALGLIGDLNLTSNTAVGLSAQRVCHATYNFAVDGGATPIVPAANCTIPINAVITNLGIQATTTVTAAGAATVAVGCTGGTACGSSALAAAAAKPAAGTFIQSTPVPQTATTWVKTTAATGLTLTIATGPLTAGVIEIYVFYYVSSS
jgi:hypothetical protein